MRHKPGPTNSNHAANKPPSATQHNNSLTPSPGQPANPAPAPAPTLACPHCPKVFGKPVKLERHLQVHHSSLSRLSIPSDILKPSPSPSPSPSPTPSPPPSTRSHPRSPVSDAHAVGRHETSEPAVETDLEIEPQSDAPDDKDALEEAEIKQSLDDNDNPTTPVQVRKVLLAALAQANLAFDAGHRSCRRCPNSARSFVSRKDLAAHIVAKHTDPDMHTTALSPPPSMSSSSVPSASSLDSAKSMKNSPARRTNINYSNSTPKRVEFSTPLATIIGEDPPVPANNSKKRPIDEVDADDMPVVPSVVKRIKTGNSDSDVIVPSSGNKPPTSPKTPPVVKAQVASRAADSSPRSITQTPPRASAASSAAPGKPSSDAKSNNKSVPASPSPTTTPDTNKNNKPISTSLPPATNSSSPITPATKADVKPSKKDAKGDAKSAKRDKNSKKKNHVLDFSVMGGIFTNSHKSYYRLVDP